MNKNIRLILTLAALVAMSSQSAKAISIRSARVSTLISGTTGASGVAANPTAALILGRVFTFKALVIRLLTLSWKEKYWQGEV
jgi:hypothetical protein